MRLKVTVESALGTLTKYDRVIAVSTDLDLVLRIDYIDKDEVQTVFITCGNWKCFAVS
jgi:hypothetical protein